MKQKDIATIIVVIAVSCIVALVLSSKLISSGHRGQQVEVVPSISSSFGQPDPKYFNAKSLDPTLFIRISNNANTAPFTTSNGQ